VDLGIGETKTSTYTSIAARRLLSRIAGLGLAEDEAGTAGGHDADVEGRAAGPEAGAPFGTCASAVLGHFMCREVMDIGEFG